MTNLKKTLAVVLAFAMILSMGSVFAFSDVEEGTTVSEAVSILANLSIIEGYEDGTFRPDETVTRAQMAAIICRMLGYEDQAQSSQGATVFNDVAADHWASGYINVAQAQGIISGYGNGNFGPNDKVLYEQAVKMIVSALGYDLAATRKGGYPTGYLAIASTEGITKKAGGRVGDAAPRSAIAVLVYNALDVQLMDQTMWATDGADEYKKIAETVLTKHHGIYKYRGILEGTPISLLAADGNEYDPDATPMALLTDAEELIYASDSLPKWADCANVFAAADKVDTDAYLAKAVILYAGEDKVTGDATIYAVAEDATKNSTFAINATQLVEEDEKYWAEEGAIGYREVGASKVKDIDIAEDAVVYVNYAIEGEANTTEDLADFIGEYGGSIEFVSCDADSEYETILVTSYEDEVVVKSVEEEDGEIIFDFYTDASSECPTDIDVEDDAALNIVYKDGEAATVADIAANDTISFLNIVDNFNIYFVSSATVEGTVDSYDTELNIVTIAGEDYEISAAYGESAKKLSGEEGIYFLNVDGQIAYSETAPTAAGKYALVLASYTASSGVEAGAFLQVVLTDGTLAEYKISDKAKVYDVEGEEVSDDVEEYFLDKLTGEKENSDAAFATVDDIKAGGLVVKLTVSSNKITKVREIEGEGDEEAGTEYDAEAKSLGSLDLDDSTVVFSVKQTDGVVEADDIVIGSIDNFFADEEKTTGDVVAFDEDEDTSVFGVLVGFGLTKTIDATSDLFIVTSKRTKTIDDVNAYVLSGVMGGDKVTVTIYDEEEDYTETDVDALSVGDVLLLAEANAEGIVADFVIVADYDKDDKSYVANAFDAEEDDEIFVGLGNVVLSESNKFAIDEAIVDAATDEEMFAAEEELSYRSSATYTLVDYVDNGNNPEVSKKTGGKSLFNVDKYESIAYVRYVDGKMADVIVFRMAEIDD